MLLDVAHHWVELEVFLGLWRLRHLKAHGPFALVVEPQFLAVDVPQEADLHVVCLPLHTDGHFHALALETDGQGRGVQHVLHCQQQVDPEGPNLTGTILERDEFLAIPPDFSPPVQGEVLDHLHLLGWVASADLRPIGVEEGTTCI